MTQPSGAQINRKTFTQSIVILLFFMLLAGVLTRLISAGKRPPRRTGRCGDGDPRLFSIY